MRSLESTKVKNCKKDNRTNHTWLSWCRLCAKPEDNDGQENGSILIRDDAGKLDTELVTSIGKYFWVNIKADEEISHNLCLDCKQLIDELKSFTEHVNKVQTLFCLLQNIKPATNNQAKKLRSQCGLIDEGFQHIIKHELPPHLKSPKSLLIDQEVQTDMICMGNHTLKLEKSITETEQDTAELCQKSVKNIEEFYEIQRDMETEYILQTDDIELYNSDLEENEQNKSKISHEEERELEVVVDMQAEEEEEPNEQLGCENRSIDGDQVQDSDLFKELKYKPVEEVKDEEEEEADKEEEEPQLKRYKLGTEEIVLEDELQDSSQQQENKLKESVELLEEGEEDEDEDDYINTTEEDEHTRAKELLLRKGKPGRPCSKNKNGENDSDYRYECIECKRKYKNPNVYRKHMKSIHDVLIEDLPDFKCSVCNKNCLTKSRLKSHMRLHLPVEEKLNIPCPYCDRKYSQVGAMRQHVNGIHHQMKPFICDQCGRACKTMAALTEHKLVHTDECPCVCEVCHRGFKNKARLKSHMDIHTQMTYKCPDCGLTLNTKRTLQQHRLVHTEEQRYKCEFCESAFKRSKALKNHLILHTGLRPYKCNFCDRTFSNGSNCRAHKRRAHPNELAEEDAAGKVSEKVCMPKLEDLKSANGILVQPRKIKRHSGGLPDNLRKLLQDSEKRKKTNESNGSEDVNNDTFEFLEDDHYDIDEFQIEGTELGDTPNEECEETVIYEIIQEM